jgi:hypothetical protein
MTADVVDKDEVVQFGEAFAARQPVPQSGSPKERLSSFSILRTPPEGRYSSTTTVRSWACATASAAVSASSRLG